MLTIWGVLPYGGLTMNEQVTLLSFGGGQDSTAILYKLIYDRAFRAEYAPGRLLVVMAATLDEHAATDRHVEQVKVLCRINNIEFVHITPDMGYHGGKWQGYRQFLRATNTCGSKAFRKTCTDNLKLKPIYRFLEAWIEKNYGFKAGRKQGLIEFAKVHGRIKVLIGIAKGEESRMSDGFLEVWANKSLEKHYPLVPLGMDRQACQDYIASVNLPVPPPSNCMLCPFMSDIELLWLSKNHPADYAEWVQLEKNKVDRFRGEGLPDEKNLGVWGRKMLPQVLAEAQVKYGTWTDAQLNDYKMSHGHCVKSKY